MLINYLDPEARQARLCGLSPTFFDSGVHQFGLHNVVDHAVGDRVGTLTAPDVHENGTRPVRTRDSRCLNARLALFECETRAVSTRDAVCVNAGLGMPERGSRYARKRDSVCGNAGLAVFERGTRGG